MALEAICQIIRHSSQSVASPGQSMAIVLSQFHRSLLNRVWTDEVSNHSSSLSKECLWNRLNRTFVNLTDKFQQQLDS